MKRTFLVLAMAAIGVGSALAQAPNTLTPQEQKEGWKLLFDGSSLNGWTTRGEVKVQDGAILIKTDVAASANTTETFDNLVLRLEFRTTPDVNSGVYIRQPPPRAGGGGGGGQGGGQAKSGAAKKRPRGPGSYEINIRETAIRPVQDSSGNYDTGSVMGVLRRTEPVTIVAGKWHSMEITGNGDHLTVVFDGKKIVDGHDTREVRPVSGTVGLQWAHPELVTGKQIEFRSIRVKALPKS
jgi:hypothetical protein